MGPAVKRLVRGLLLALALVALATFAALSLWFGGRSAWAALGTMAARTQVTAWRNAEGLSTLAARWAPTAQTLQEGLQISPNDAELQGDLAYLYSQQAIAAQATTPSEANAFWDQAIAHYRSEAQLRPTFPYGWAYLATAKLYRGQIDAEMWAAFDTALAHGVNEGGVQPALATVAFANWDTLDTHYKQRIKDMVNRAHKDVRPELEKLASAFGVALQ